jgi:hypothetical protein
MPYVLAIDEESRVWSVASGSDYTAETVVHLDETNLFVEEFDMSDLFKIYNSEMGTFIADDQTELLKNPIVEPETDPVAAE